MSDPVKVSPVREIFWSAYRFVAAPRGVVGSALKVNRPDIDPPLVATDEATPLSTYAFVAASRGEIGWDARLKPPDRDPPDRGSAVANF